ncbi:MFS transporter, partial [Methylobacterium frigidaeris]
KDLTGTFTAGLLVLGAVTLAGGIVAMTLKVSRDLESAVAKKAAPAE